MGSSDTTAARVRAAFNEQAYWCTMLGSSFTALLCTTLGERLDTTTAIGDRVLSWSGDPTSQGDALALRVCGALHRLARSGEDPELTALYPGSAQQPSADDLWWAVRRALERHPSLFEAYLATPPQTNEVGRSAALMCGFLEITKRCRLPMQLYEIGASAGLNLIPDRYRYRFGEAQWGDPQAGVLLEPQWQGPAPAIDAQFRVTQRRGCDISPLDISIPAERERLISYVWADQLHRLSRIEAAIETALYDPPRLERMEAAEWVEQRLTEVPEECGSVRVLFHSVVWRYFTVETQRRIEEHMRRCGSHAHTDAPLAWLRLELVDKAPGAELILTLWPTGEETVLAYSQPHGNSIVHLER